MTIFILHYRDDALTNATARAWSAQGKVLVVDNGSPTPYVPDCDVEVMRLERNLFLIEAFNVAMHAHPGEYYLNVNNDVTPHEGCVDRLLDALDDLDVGIVAPGTNDKGAGALYVEFPSPNWPSMTMRHVDNHCIGWRHDVLETIGYPDCMNHTHRACWGSNQDYAYRARKAGYKVMAVKAAYVYHAHNGDQDYAAWKAGQDWLDAKWGDEAKLI